MFNYRLCNKADTASVNVRAIIVVAIMMTLLSGCSPTRALNSLLDDSGYQRRTALAYGDEPRQRLDVYLPVESLEAAQTIVFVYGGGWRSGSRELYRFVAHHLVNAGHRVILPDYRLVPRVQFPAFVEDVADAISWVRRNPAAAGVEPTDMDSIVLMGHSSGAHTASLLAADASWLTGSGVNVKALIGISGPYKLPLDNREVAAAFPRELSQPKALPLKHISGEHPRTLLIHGTDDKRVLPMHSQVFFNALHERSVDVDLRMLDGAGHAAAIASLASPFDWLNNAGEIVLDFLNALP